LVERLYLRDLVTFKELELEFLPGLVVFTGPSGAGKSVLISAILSAFGYGVKGSAALCELNLKKPAKLQSEAFVLEETLCIKTLKKEKLRYFIDGQSIPKKVLSDIFSPYVRYLSVRDQSGMDTVSLLNIIDTLLSSRDHTFKKLHKMYRQRYADYRRKALQLEKMREDERMLAEKMEFMRYEIEKISTINPNPDEEEALLAVKQQLSRIDKIRDALAYANGIFQFESSVEELYRLLGKDVTSFSEAMNQLRADFEESEVLAAELEETDVEAVLDRLGELTVLKNRYGSIEEALSYKESKEKELAACQHLEQDKSMLEQFLQAESHELNILASRISQSRKKEAKALESVLEKYLGSLKLPALHFEFAASTLGEHGIDNVQITLGGSSLQTLSGGEFNRVRLALMAAGMPEGEKMHGVLILDEIDANVSGDESIAIAEMIAELARGYQVFAISHQPHLSAKATQHIVVEKEQGVSCARVLDEVGRVGEIARIIAGEKPTEQAVAFAQKLRS